MAIVVILKGVSSCGKTSVGKRLSAALSWPFVDGDDLHPQSNIDKMSQGLPLTDEDRQPWLLRLHTVIDEHLEMNQSLIIASSALKQKYRQILCGEKETNKIVHLSGSYDLIHERMKNREGHYMRPEMLHSQFADLELPQHALTIAIDQPVDIIAKEIIDKLKLQGDKN